MLCSWLAISSRPTGTGARRPSCGERGTAPARRLDERPWLTYRLANSLRTQGAFYEADSTFDDLLARKPADPTTRYAHALYLAAAERDAQALTSLQQIQASDWNDDIRALATRVERREFMSRVAKLRAAGRKPRRPI